MDKVIPKIGFMLMAYEQEIESAETIKPIYDTVAKELMTRGIDIIIPENYVILERDAREQAQKFQSAGIDLFLMMVGTWTNANYAISALKVLNDIPFIIYAYNDLGPGMTCRLQGPTFGFTGAVEIKNSIDQMGYKDKYEFIVGPPDNKNTMERIVKIARVAATRKKLQNCTIGLIGYYTMGMYSATFDAISLKEKIGVTIEHIGENILINETEKSDEGKANEIAQSVMSRCTVVDPKRTDEKEFIKNGKMYLAYKRLIDRYRLDAVNTKCDPELGVHYGQCACFAHSLLVDEGVMSSCEGDIHQTLSMMVLHYLSGKPVMFLDVVGACEENNSLQFMSCGFAPTLIAKNSKDVKLYPQIEMKGNGITQSYSLHPGARVTLYRIDGRYPRGSYSGHIISGISSESRPIVKEWPSVEVVLDKEKGWAHFSQNCTADHFALVIGDYREELLFFNQQMGFESIKTL
ncbi:MAG: hypothetical protein JSV25_07965 [Spirochaetota bacterium]|nr:MAG: hypothetical protein JSV25_07965 [Spirochaetota bacterium]